MLEIGQKLWLVPKNRPSCEIEISAIGRKWVSVTGLRKYKVDRAHLEESGHAGVFDDGFCVGTCYVDRVGYEAKQQLHADWRGLYDSISRSGPPKGVTVADIEQARKLLGL